MSRKRPASYLCSLCILMSNAHRPPPSGSERNRSNKSRKKMCISNSYLSAFSRRAVVAAVRSTLRGCNIRNILIPVQHFYREKCFFNIKSVSGPYLK